MKYAIASILITLIAFNQSHADDEKKLKKRQLIEKADYYFFKENFPKALELYDQLLINYPKNHYVQYHRYVAHHLTEGRGSELSELLEYERNEGQTDKFYNYWLGRIHYGRYEFELAEEHFKAFLNLDIYRTREIIKESKARLAKTVKSKKFYLNPNEYEVELLPSPINSEFSDVSPAFFADHGELLFVSSRPKVASDSVQKDTYRVFHSIKKGKTWSSPTSVESVGELHDNHPIIEVVNQDGRLFMYNREKHDLFYSEPTETSWTAPREFDSNLQKKQIASHFFINDQEDLILFSTVGLSGNLDIFQSKKDASTGEWSAPSSLSTNVNSKSDEDSPYLSHDGKTLYFSSNRRESIGGFDIFKTEWNDETNNWGPSVNIGFPINTIDDEINFQLNEDNISGFLSSNRIHGRGEFDIYHFHKQGKVLAQGAVYEKSSGKKLVGLQVDFRPKKYKDETFRTITDAEGKFDIEILQNEPFIVEISMDGQQIHKEKISSDHEALKKEFTKNFYVTIPDKLESKTDFAALYDTSIGESKYEKVNMLGSKFRKGKKAMLKNIYFDLQSASIKSESMPMLNTLLSTMQDNKDLKIEIGGHTDSTGGTDINNKLSKDRAESVKAYLVSQGVKGDRIITKGYGASQPLASNDDEEDGRELNRRIEVIVIN